MNKVTIAGLVAAAMLLPALASAATISNPLFSNGQNSIDVNGGGTVSGTFTLTVGPGEVVEFLRTQSDPSQPFVDTSVGGTLGYQEQVYTNVPFSVKVPPNTGTYYPTVQGAGIFGGNRSINGNDNVVLGATTLGTVRVVANAVDSSTAVGGSDDFWSKLAGIIAAAFKANNPAPAPAASAACTAYAAANAGTQYGVTNNANVALQGFLLSQHMSIPALAAGASFGFDGPQTEAARTAFLSSAHCQ